MNTRMLKIIVVTCLSLGLFLSLGAKAGNSAKDLVEQVFNKNSWQDMQGEIQLILTNPSGQKRQRTIKMWSKSNAKDETSMLMRFVKPADVKGTGFLTIEHKGADDDRRLFLPALRRVKRISTSGSGGNFMSSDFTYYDIGMPKLEHWKYSFGTDKKIQGVMCKSVIGVAVSPQVIDDTSYSKVIWYIDPARKISLAAEYFEKGGRQIKKLQVLKVEMIKGTPFATDMKMTDVNTGHSSEMIFEKLKTDSGIPDKTFSQRNLQKWNRR